MGVVLDSTVLIAAERAGKNPRKVIQEIAAVLGDTEAALSVVSSIELAHGIERANTIERRAVGPSDVCVRCVRRIGGGVFNSGIAVRWDAVPNGRPDGRHTHANDGQQGDGTA